METRSRSPARNTRRQTKKKSPVTLSTGRKSPSRKSPSRKSPSRRSPEKTKTVEKTTIREKIVENKTSSSPLFDKARLSPSRNLKIRLDKIDSRMTVKSMKISSSSSDTVDIGSVLAQHHQQQRPPSATAALLKPDDISGDSEIAKITSITRRSASVTKLTPTHHLTPTPSATATTDQLSRHSRSASRSVYDASKTEYSDDEDGNAEERDDDGQSSYSNYQYGSGIRGKGGLYSNSYPKSTSASRYIPAPKEYGGAFGIAVLLILVPILVYYLQWSCADKTNSCKLMKINIPKSVSAILPNLNSFEKAFTKDTVGAFISYTVALYLLSAVVRIGYDVKLPPSDRVTKHYHFNALAISILTTISFIIGEIYFSKYSVSNFILRNYMKLTLFNILSAFVLSSWCFIRSRFIPLFQWNPYAKSGNFIIDFSIGREITPKWFQLIDIKLLCYRASLISSLLLLEVLIYKNLHFTKIQPSIIATTAENATSSITATAIESIQYYYRNFNINDGSALFSTLLVLIYILDSIIFEHHLATSFELQQEGVGALLLLRYAITPFLLVSIPKYALEHKPLNLPLWLMISATVLLISGLILKRKSNSIKYRYRMDPYNRELAFMDTVPTFQGKRLLLGKLWGTVRQPNYAGDILSLLALLLPLYGKFAWPPLISVALIIIYLIHRAHRVNARNFARYNSAWQRYCTKVRYMIIPKIY